MKIQTYLWWTPCCRACPARRPWPASWAAAARWRSAATGRAGVRPCPAVPASVSASPARPSSGSSRRRIPLCVIFLCKFTKSEITSYNINLTDSKFSLDRCHRKDRQSCGRSLHGRSCRWLWGRLGGRPDRLPRPVASALKFFYRFYRFTLYPDPLVRGTDLDADPAPDPDPSILKKDSKKILNTTLLWLPRLLIFEIWCKCSLNTEKSTKPVTNTIGDSVILH